MESESGYIRSKRFTKRNILKYLGLGGIAGGAGILSSQKAHAASQVQFVFMHGTSVQIEDMSKITNVFRRGFYTTVQAKSNTFNWFHFAIPTTFFTSTPLRLERAGVAFETPGKNVLVTNLHVYMINNKIAEIDGQTLSGSNGIEVTLNPAKLYSGAIGLSVGVSFGADSSPYINFLEGWAQFG